MDYRFVVQVMLQMLHARARLSLSLSSLFFSCVSPNINQPTVVQRDRLPPQFSPIRFLLIRRAYLKRVSIRIVQRILYYHLQRAWDLWTRPRFSVSRCWIRHVRKVFVKFYDCKKQLAIYCNRFQLKFFSHLYLVFLHIQIKTFYYQKLCSYLIFNTICFIRLFSLQFSRFWHRIPR